MDIADILIHVHPTLSAEQRAKIEDALIASKGVVAATFSHGQPHMQTVAYDSAEVGAQEALHPHGHPHMLTVAYDPEVAHAGQLLETVREWDAAATMVGL